MDKYIYIYTHTHIYIHTHTHTHTYIYICDILKVAPGEAKLPDIQLIIYGKEKLVNWQMPEVNHS